MASGLSTSGNSTLTQAQVEALLIKPLVQKSTYLSLGIPTFTSNGEPIKLPSLTADFSPSFAAEGSAIAELTASTSEITLLASTVWPAKSILRVSNQMIAQGVFNVQDQFSRTMVDAVARKVDAALWNGNGASGSPLGIAQFTGFSNAGTVAGTALTSTDLFTMDRVANLAYADQSSLWFAMSPVNFDRVRKLSDNYGARVLAPSLADGAPGTLLGHGYTVTAALPDTSILLFDRSQVAVGLDRSASVSFHPDTYAQYDETAVRVSFRADTKALNATGVTKLTIS